jgi:hypothetical protein
MKHKFVIVRDDDEQPYYVSADSRIVPVQP